jgi:hypothetical protein
MVGACAGSRGREREPASVPAPLLQSRGLDRSIVEAAMTRIDVALFNYQDGLSASMPCLENGEQVGRPSMCGSCPKPCRVRRVACHELGSFTSQGGQCCEVSDRPALPEGLPMLADDDLLFENEHTAPCHDQGDAVNAGHNPPAHKKRQQDPLTVHA